MTSTSLSSFADQDTAARLAKAGPIAEAFRRYQPDITGRRPMLLDIGTGAGVTGTEVARKLDAEYVLMDTTADAISDTSRFIVGSGETMPFATNSFDYVIANHVIEHVNNPDRLMEELHRVLTPTGVAYLATPSKYTVLEPHYRLPLLSWMPRYLADATVRVTRRGDKFRVSPMRRADVRRFAQTAGLHAHDITAESIKTRAASTGRSLLTSAAASLPPVLLRAALPIAPSHIWILSKEPAQKAALAG